MGPTTRPRSAMALEASPAPPHTSMASKRMASGRSGRNSGSGARSKVASSASSSKIPAMRKATRAGNSNRL
eukprot:2083699-Heterocapsa_arctica.AAC.1